MNIRSLSLLALCAFVPLAALADRDHKHHGKYKEEYWDGNCKVERKLEKNGDYKEKRKCKGAPPPVNQVYVPAPVIVPAPVVEPGLVIQGTVRVK